VTKALSPAAVVTLDTMMKSLTIMSLSLVSCIQDLNFTRAYTALCLFPHPESLYNDGKGIQINASLIGLLPRPKSGEKRRANAKPPVTTKVVYIHEKTDFIGGLIQIIGRALKRSDLCRGGLDRSGNLHKKTSSLFSLSYTIPRTQLKDVEILSEDDWATFLEEAGKKPSAQGKLAIKEKLVSLVFSLLSNQTQIVNWFNHICYHRQLRPRQPLRLRLKSRAMKMMRTIGRRKKIK
jgi:hypothetical protein